MATILQLKVDGISYDYSTLTRVIEITQKEYDELLPLMKVIIEMKKNKSVWNFSKFKALDWSYIKNDWVQEYTVKKDYPGFEKEIDKLMNYIPDNVGGISSFELIRTETLDKLV